MSSININEKFLTIPNRLLVGFSKGWRKSFTGQIAQITYYKRGNKIQSEGTWNSSRDNSISPIEVENVPTSGFTINKKKDTDPGEKWTETKFFNTLVYDPRGFEFSITYQNLVYILEKCWCGPGGCFIGEFVYAWDEDNSLVLLPLDSEDYIESREMQDKINSQDIKPKDLIPGKAYKTKDHNIAYYLGKLDWKLRDTSYSSATTKTIISTYHSFLVKDDMSGGDTIFGINSILNNIIVARDDIPQLNNTEIGAYKSRFMSTFAGCTEKLTEIRLGKVPDDIQNKFNEVVVNRIPGCRCEAARVISDRKIEIIFIRVTDDKSIIYTNRYEMIVHDSGLFELKDFIVIPAERALRQEIINLFKPVSVYSVYGKSNNNTWEVRAGDVWIRGDELDVNGVYKIKPQIILP